MLSEQDVAELDTIGRRTVRATGDEPAGPAVAEGDREPAGRRIAVDGADTVSPSSPAGATGCDA